MDKIPQVPAHAATDFKENRRIAKTIIKYWCTKGYRFVFQLEQIVPLNMHHFFAWMMATSPIIIMDEIRGLN